MSDRSGIEWTDATWNPVSGCVKVSAGCKNCYAERLFPRVYGRSGRKFTDVVCHDDRLDQPLRWRKPRRVFVNSMSDLFHEDVPDAFIEEVFRVMYMAHHHQFQVLTKRPERMREFVIDNPTLTTDLMAAVRASRGEPVPPLPNVWLGVSVEDQAAAEKRIPHLLATPAAVRFISAEPLIGPVDLRRLDRGAWIDCIGGDVISKRHGDVYSCTPSVLDWVIVGGESGPNARPMQVAWARSIIDQCRSSRVPVFVKQLGSHPLIPTTDGGTARFPTNHRAGGDITEWPVDLMVREYPKVVHS